MSADNLKACIATAVQKLRKVDESRASLQTKSFGKLTLDNLGRCATSASHLNETVRLLDIRTSAWGRLAGLRQVKEANDPELSGNIFEHERLLRLQAYLSTAWALCDRIAVATVPLVAKPTKDHQGFFDTFVRNNNNSIPGCLAQTVREEFGWCSGFSYAARNHFLHDAGIIKDGPFFRGATPGDGFLISEAGITHLSEKLKEYGFAVSPPESQSIEWPSSDLFNVLRLSQESVDIAVVVVLSVLSRWAFELATALDSA